MSFQHLIVCRRTVRRFQRHPVEPEVIEHIVDAGRLAPSAANMQPLEFVAIDDPKICTEIFPCLRWAAYIAPNGDPPPGEEPAAYIIVLVNLGIRDKMFEYDVGAAVENMILSALEEYISACWMISIDREKIARILGVPEGYRVDSVLALGRPAERPVIEEFSDSVKYWKDDKGVLHVPKRKLKSVLHLNKF